MEIQLFVKTDSGKSLPVEATQIVVTEKLGQPRTYSITFPEDICDDDFMFLGNTWMDPFKELTISVKINDGDEQLLVKGPVQKQNITMHHGGQGSSLKIDGADNSVQLGWKVVKKSWDKHITEGEIMQILQNATHQFENINVLGNTRKFNKDEAKNLKGKVKTLKTNQFQKEADLPFIQKLARQCGCYFWVSYEGKDEIANFDTLRLDTEATHQLVINLPDNNIDELNITWDANRPTYVEALEIDSKSGDISKVQKSDVTLINEQDITLYELTKGAFTSRLTVPGSTTLEMVDKAKAAVDESTWFLHANCSTSYEKICSPKTGLIQAHRIIKLTGAGSRYDGKYAVSGVTHTIDKVSYKLQLELMRNGWHRPSNNASANASKQQTVGK
jgi:hypothetical protein